MMKIWFERIKRLGYPSTWYDWQLDLQSWWYTREKGHLVFIPVLVLIPVVVAGLVYHSIETSRINSELRCLALNIYHEARGEPKQGQYAVAEVTMNRVASKYFPNTVCEVVYEKRWDRIRKRYVGAFSWTEITSKSTLVNRKLMQRAWQVAEAVYHRREEPKVKGALFYHARYIRPSWARTKIKVAHIGQHIFYK